MTATPHRPLVETRTHSRRAALCGGALVATLGTLALRLSAAAQATPEAAEMPATTLLVQCFGQGSLFPTQGDGGVLPYTAILWDAAERGFLSLDPTSGSLGVVSTESVLTALGAATDPPAAVLLSLAGGNGATGAIWAMRLVSGELGSDPGAVTYQGEPLIGDDAPSWLGDAPPRLPDSPQDLGAGYLVIDGLSVGAAG
jgi:hypothetical protein